MQDPVSHQGEDFVSCRLGVRAFDDQRPMTSWMNLYNRFRHGPSTLVWLTFGSKTSDLVSQHANIGLA